MREIKFRAWDKTRQRFEKLGITLTLDGQILKSGWNRNGYGTLVNTSDVEIMQYTGLKDKNGKESYFDDLVKWGKSIYQVVWNNTEGIAQLIKCSGSEVFATLPIRELQKGKIIGNSYENPELSP